MDRSGEEAPDSTGVLSCVIFGRVLPNGGGKVDWVLLPSVRCVVCSLHGLWPVTGMFMMVVSFSEHTVY